MLICLSEARYAPFALVAAAIAPTARAALDAERNQKLALGTRLHWRRQNRLVRAAQHLANEHGNESEGSKSVETRETLRQAWLDRQ